MFGRKKPAQTVVVGVQGMTCMGCVGRLERTVKGAAGADVVEVTLEPGRLRVTGALSTAEVIALVEKAGFRGDATAFAQSEEQT